MTDNTIIAYYSIIIGVVAVDMVRMAALGVALLYRRIRKKNNISQSNC